MKSVWKASRCDAELGSDRCVSQTTRLQSCGPPSCAGVPYPGRKIPLGSQDALGGKFPLVLQEVHGRLEPYHFALPTVFPSHVEHEAEEHHADAAAVVAGQVYGQQGAQAFAEGPQHADGALPGRVARRPGSHERRTSARGRLRKGGRHCDGLKFVLRLRSLARSGHPILELRHREEAATTEDPPHRCPGNHGGWAADCRCAPRDRIVSSAAGRQAGESVFTSGFFELLGVHGTGTATEQGRRVYTSTPPSSGEPTCSVTRRQANRCLHVSVCFLRKKKKKKIDNHWPEILNGHLNGVSAPWSVISKFMMDFVLFFFSSYITGVSPAACASAHHRCCSCRSSNVTGVRYHCNNDLQAAIAHEDEWKWSLRHSYAASWKEVWKPFSFLFIKSTSPWVFLFYYLSNALSASLAWQR